MQSFSGEYHASGASLAYDHYKTDLFHYLFRRLFAQR